MEENARLRRIDMKWIVYEGRQVLALTDSLRLSGGQTILVPPPLVPLLALCDGTRNLPELQSDFNLRTGQSIPEDQIRAFVDGLDKAFLLQNRRYREAVAQAMDRYRSAPHRPPRLAGAGYPSDPVQLSAAFDGYLQQAEVADAAAWEGVAGVISPHIDYHRGWRTYAATWQAARSAVQAAELIIILGTDHAGLPGTMTLTRQSYGTPWGPLPTDVDLVDRLASALGDEAAFAQEPHHLGEHSIELASTWVHYAAGGEPKFVLPVLCGSHDAILGAGSDSGQSIWDAVDIMARAARQRRTLVVAAGDLSHMGPVFGDASPLEEADKAQLEALDGEWLEAACTGDSAALTAHILSRRDPTRICGSAPIHYMAHILQGATGQVLTYEQCPADDTFGSLVSIAGALFSD